MPTPAEALTATRRIKVGDRFYEAGEDIQIDLPDKEKGILLHRGLVTQEAVEDDVHEGADVDSTATSPAGSDDTPPPDSGVSTSLPVDGLEGTSEDPAGEVEEDDEEEDEEFPKRVGTSSWYILSDGDKVQGKEYAEELQSELDANEE